MADVTFSFMTRSMSAYDASHIIMDNPEQQFQLANAASGDPHHEVEFRQDATTPGDPTSPLILSAILSPSNFYVEFRFADTPVYMTIPATSTVTIGWLERNKSDG